MKQLKIYQVDAFADSVFQGNPAAFCPLEHWFDDEILQAIAQETTWQKPHFSFQEIMDFIFVGLTEHIGNVFKEGELNEKEVCRLFRHTTRHGAIEGKTQS